MRRMTTRLTCVLSVFVCGFFLYGCNIINPKEKIPTYLHIDSFQFKPTSTLPGVTLSHRVNSVFVFYNNNTVGAFDLPCTIPIVTDKESGTGTIQIAPTIAINGMNDVMGIYPFYRYDTFTFNIQPGKIINRVPQSSFYPATKVINIANFENANTGFFLWLGNKKIDRVTDPAEVFEGTGSGCINISAVGDSSIDSSTLSTQLTMTPGEPSFIEFNYKSDIPFTIGLQPIGSALGPLNPIFGQGMIAPSSTWKKFYYNAQTLVNTYEATSYVFYIKASYSSANAAGKVWFDNIQLVKF